MPLWSIKYNNILKLMYQVETRFLTCKLKIIWLIRYTCSMQLEVKQREKMKRRRSLQLVLFLKICMIIGLIAGCGIAARVWKVPVFWAIFCTGHSLQANLIFIFFLNKKWRVNLLIYHWYFRDFVLLFLLLAIVTLSRFILESKNNLNNR